MSGSFAFVASGDRMFRAEVPSGRADVVTLSARDLSTAQRTVLWTVTIEVHHPVAALRLVRQSEGLCVEVDAIIADGRRQTFVWVYRDDGVCAWQE